MLLTELLGIKALKNQTAGQILKQIKLNNGVTMVRGVYGIVLTHPDWDYVLKLIPKDDCYMNFVEYCKRNKSPHLPKIVKGPIELTPFFKDKNGHDVKDQLEKYYAVKIEKLDPLPSSGELHNVSFIVLNDGRLTDEYDGAETAKEKKEILAAYTEAYKGHKYAANLLKHGSLVDAVIKIRNALDFTKCQLDFSIGNVMLRGSTIVIIDPYKSNTKSGMSLMKIISKSDLAALTGI